MVETILKYNILIFILLNQKNYLKKNIFLLSNKMYSCKYFIYCIGSTILN